MITLVALASPASSKPFLGRLSDAQALRRARIVPQDEMLAQMSDESVYREMQSMGTEVMLVDWPGPIRAIVFYKGERPTLEDLLAIYQKVILDLTGSEQTVH